MYRIGIDLGGTNIAVGLVDENYRIARKASLPTNAKNRSAEAIIDDMVILCRRLTAEEGITLSDIAAIGVASPGMVDHDRGVVECATNLPFTHFPVADMLRQRTGVALVHAENDANAAAFAEALAGAARGTKNSVMITLGTGVGGGVIMDGKIYSGFNYAGAELGHIVIERDGAACSCVRSGCWEAYSSATGLIRMTREKIAACEQAGKKTLMTELVATKGKVSGRTAFDAARAGDAAAQEVVDEFLARLAVGIGNIINLFRPEVLTIGGGIAGEGDNLLRPLLPLIERECGTGDGAPTTRVLIAELGNDAGIIGAAYLGITL